MKIGIEIHVQLRTQTKLFCGCPNKFVNEPNKNVCEYCIGMPGSKPRVNEKAVESAIKTGLALNCKFPREMFFSRKSYFYPDMGKNFQISQYEIPVAMNGLLRTNNKKIRIGRIQIEEDPARIIHVTGGGDDIRQRIASITSAKYMLVDYNRSGTPLIEIVTEPDFESPQEVRIWLQRLSGILEYLDIYDSCIEGSMRVDANISIHDERVEIKNISGFKDVEKALNYEIIRQKNITRKCQKVIRETRTWDDVSGTTKSLRTKEEEEDYGYIFEPDLVKITIDRKKLEKIRKKLPEFAEQKTERYMKEFKIEKEIAESITTQPDLAEMFEAVIKKIDPKLAARWFSKELKKTLNFNNLRIRQTGLGPEHVIKLLKLLKTKKITERTAEMMLREIVIKPIDPEKLIKEKRAVRIFEDKILSPVIQDVIAENASAVVDFRAGKNEAFNFLIGQVMRKTEGRGDPEAIRKLLRKMLGA